MPERRNGSSPPPPPLWGPVHDTTVPLAAVLEPSPVQTWHLHNVYPVLKLEQNCSLRQNITEKERKISLPKNNRKCSYCN